MTAGIQNLSSRRGLSLKAVLFTFILPALLSFESVASAEDRAELAKTTIFGIEYTFQDQAMVDEPGRSTIYTRHKTQKLRIFRDELAKRLAIGDSNIRGWWKFGRLFNIELPWRDFPTMRGVTLRHSTETYSALVEPVSIEVSHDPKHLNEIEAAGQPIFDISKEMGLEPYLRPAAERSGMGHIHTGGQTLGESPYFRHPRLLRNVFAYFHKHPSLLYGFSEAYDIGERSNIETYHRPDRQKVLEQAIAEFDLWYATASDNERAHGCERFLRILQKKSTGSTDFFNHYRFINIGNMLSALKKGFSPQLKGKFTVEYRLFRPFKSPSHARSAAAMLLAVFEKLTTGDDVEPFETISPAQFRLFWTGSKVAADWEFVRQDLRLDDAHLDEMVGEFTHAVHAFKRSPLDQREFEIFDAYSQKENKGTAFELRIPRTDENSPSVELNNREIEMSPLTVGGTHYWIAYIDSKDIAIKPSDLFHADIKIKSKTKACADSVRP